MIRNGDVNIHNITPTTKHPTCIDCGVQFSRKGPAKRCKPCTSVHMDRGSNRRNKERQARKRAERAANAE
jgi:hypothetical protein